MRPATTRDDLLDQLAEVGRMAVDSGLALASGGNLSARLPGADEFVVTGAGTWLDRLTAERLQRDDPGRRGRRRGGAAVE